jgi:hypothetical protein
VGLLDPLARVGPPGDGPDERPRHAAHLAPGQQAERIVAINDRLQLDIHDAERIANDALSAL